MPIKLGRTQKEILSDALCKCNHTKKFLVPPFWTTEGTLDIKTIYCQQCDTFVGYLTRKHPVIPQEDSSSTVKMHQKANLKYPLFFKQERNGKLNQ